MGDVIGYSGGGASGRQAVQILLDVRVDLRCSFAGRTLMNSSTGSTPLLSR
jgi:hypothetical protein